MKDTEVQLAEKIARKVHKNQIRKFGEDKGKPYIVHPERMANKMISPVMKAAAYLHDTVEDGNISFDDLSNQGISETVLDIVEAVTKKQGENYLDFILRISENSKAAILKREDIRDNLNGLQEGSLKDKYRLALWILEGNRVLY